MISYDLMARFYEHIVDDVLYAIYLDLIEKNTVPCQALEVGCGTATLSRELSRKGYQMTALDNNQAMLDVASFYAGLESLTIHFVHQDAVMGLPSGFPLIIVPTDVINHLENEEAVHQLVVNLTSALTTNGILIVDFLRCEYLASLNGYFETIQIDGEAIQWSIHPTATPCTVKHCIQVGHECASHLERSYDQAFYEKVFSDYTRLQEVVLEERIIWVLKKVK